MQPAHKLRKAQKSSGNNKSFSIDGVTPEGPYLTHHVQHLGQTTLIPPENLGRVRKVGRSSEDLRIKGKGSRPTSILSLPSSPGGSTSGSTTYSASQNATVLKKSPQQRSFEVSVAGSSRNKYSTPVSPATLRSPRSERRGLSEGDASSSSLGETEWEKDRAAGFSLDERVRREFERRTKGEGGGRNTGPGPWDGGLGEYHVMVVKPSQSTIAARRKEKAGYAGEEKGKRAVSESAPSPPPTMDRGGVRMENTPLLQVTNGNLIPTSLYFPFGIVSLTPDANRRPLPPIPEAGSVRRRPVDLPPPWSSSPLPEHSFSRPVSMISSVSGLGSPVGSIMQLNGIWQSDGRSNSAPSTRQSPLMAPVSPSIMPPPSARDLTELDVLVAGIDDPESRNGDNYEALLTLGEIMGPARGPMSQGSSSGYVSTDIDLPESPVKVARRRLTKDGKVRVKLVLDDHPVERCGICLNQFKEGDAGTLLGCKHSFHVRCLRTWTRTSRTCPTCRGNIS